MEQSSKLPPDVFPTEYSSVGPGVLENKCGQASSNPKMENHEEIKRSIFIIKNDVQKMTTRFCNGRFSISQSNGHRSTGNEKIFLNCKTAIPPIHAIRNRDRSGWLGWQFSGSDIFIRVTWGLILCEGKNHRQKSSGPNVHLIRLFFLTSKSPQTNLQAI